MRGHVRQRCSCPKINGERKCKATGKRCPSPWSVVVELSRDPDTGRRRQKWHSGYQTRKEAERAMTDLVGRIDQGTYVAPSKQTLAEYLILDWLPAIRATVRPSTFHSYSRNLRLHVIPVLGERRLPDVDPGALNALYGRLRASGRKDTEGGGLSPRTVGYVHTILHRAFKDAVNWGRLTRNPADSAQPPKASANETEARELHTWTGQQEPRSSAAARTATIATTLRG